jgi:hypothetical protein
MLRRVIGIVLIVFGTFANAAHLAIGSYSVPLWFCYFAPILAGIGLLFDRPNLIFAYVSLGIIVQPLFAIDLVRVYASLPQFFELVRHDPFVYPIFIRAADIVVHLVTLPLAIAGALLSDVPSRRSFIAFYTTGFLIVIVASLMVGDVNCVDGGCLPQSIVASPAMYVFTLVLIGIVLPLIMFEGLGALNRAIARWMS